MVHIDLRMNSRNSRFLDVTVKSPNEKPGNCIFKMSTKSILDSVDILEIQFPDFSFRKIIVKSVKIESSLNLSYDIYGYLADELSSWLFHLEISPKSRNQKLSDLSFTYSTQKWSRSNKIF